MANLTGQIAGLPVTVWRKWREFARKLWARVVLMGLLALASLAIASLAGGLLPAALATSVSGQAADTLLRIIANAMLAVTTFSLTVMVTVYRASSTQFTPRLHRLIMQDRTTQNTLAAFIGAYVFALTGIILRELDIFGDDRAFVLFAMTVGVLIYVVASMVRWVLHLQTFGSLIDTSRTLEDIIMTQFRERLAAPCLGAHPWDGQIPATAMTLASAKTGYVQQYYQEALNVWAKAADIQIYLPASVGAFVFAGDPIAHVISIPGKPAPSRESLNTCMTDHVRIGDLRTYDQDPRFGLMALGEMASKALSPGINDPGTAIDVLTRQARILLAYHNETQSDAPVTYQHLYMRPLSAPDLIEDAFAAWARDGAGIVEVQQRLQKALAGLMTHAAPDMANAARAYARIAFARANACLTFAGDRARLRSATDPAVRDE